ncbi:hypothetical protein [Peribacillus simplex]|uniref:hypothetical protein n=1 Tax=Peribacillus simplex TaxID=1478 RepID=UPI003CF85A3A
MKYFKLVKLTGTFTLKSEVAAAIFFLKELTGALAEDRSCLVFKAAFSLFTIEGRIIE